MKKLLFVLLVIFTSCGYSPIDNSKAIIIHSIEQYDDVYCNYYGVGNMNMVWTPTSVYFKIRDTCGKFQVGDTIKLIK